MISLGHKADLGTPGIERQNERICGFYLRKKSKVFYFVCASVYEAIGPDEKENLFFLIVFLGFRTGGGSSKTGGSQTAAHINYIFVFKLPRVTFYRILIILSLLC